MSAFTFSTSVTASGDLAQDAPETNGAGDDLTVNAGVLVSSTGGNVTLTAGDDVLIHGTVAATSATKKLTIVAGSNDADGLGAITLDGAISSVNASLGAHSGITVAGRLNATGALDLATAGGGVHQTSAGKITAGRLQSHGGIVGDVDLTAAANNIAALGDLAVTGGAFKLNDTAATLTINGPLSADDVTITSSGTIAHAAASTTQKLTVTGSFTIGFNGGETPFYSSDTLTAATLQADLNTLAGTTDAITVTGSGGAFTIVFGGPFAGTAVPLIAFTGGVITAFDLIAAGDSTIAAHTVTLIADQMALNAGLVTARDTITLAPLTAGTAVALGDGVTATFALSAAELATLSAPEVVIGRNTSGTVTAGPISIGSASVATSALDLYSQGAVTLTTGTLNVGGGTGTLTVTAGGPVMFGGAALMVLNAAAVGGSTTNGAFGVANTGTNTVTGAAITTQGGEITLRNAGGSVVVDGALASHGGHVMAGTRAAGGNTTVNADIDAGAGTIVLVATGGSVTQTAGKLTGANLLSLSAPTLDLTLDGADNAITGRVALVGHDVNFTDTQAFTIGAASVHFASTGVFIAPPAGAAINAGGSLALTTGGDIAEGHDLNDSIIAGTLSLARLGSANPNVTLDNVNNQIGKLGAVDLGSGALTLVDAGALAVTGAVTAGAVTLTAAGITFAGGEVTTSGAQAYHGAATLAAATTLTSNGPISFDGTLGTGVFDLTVNVASASLFDHVISGNGRFIKEGLGAVTLSAADSYTGATLVDAGTLLVDGTLASSLVTVADGATLGGHGTVGALIVASGATLAPGDSPGTLNTGDVALFAGSHVAIELGGAAAGQYDQLDVHGAVTLGGAILDASLVNGFAPALGQSFMLIDNDGSDAVGGTFAGLSEGAFVTIDGSVFTISYHGGDGNDVVLDVLANHAPVNSVPPTQSAVPGTDLAITGLAIADQDAGAGTLTTTLSVAHGTLHAASGHAAVAGDGSGSVTLTGTLDQINATLASSLTYHGAAGFSGTDTLTMLTSDNGHTGLPGALTDSDTVKIDVTAPVHQAPQTIVGSANDDGFIAPAGDSIIEGRGGVDTVAFDFKLVDATVSYSGNQIIIDGPNGSHTVLNGIEVFVFADGTVNNADGSPLVDDLFYYSHNHDVWNAHVDADTHYSTVGWHEGRDPNAFFDTKGYLAHYADVAAAGLNPLTHYDQNGWHEGRDPSTAFDTGDYLAHNPDVAAAHLDPLAHFLQNGAAEGRQAFGDGVWG